MVAKQIHYNIYTRHDSIIASGTNRLGRMHKKFRLRRAIGSRIRFPVNHVIYDGSRTVHVICLLVAERHGFEVIEPDITEPGEEARVRSSRARALDDAVCCGVASTQVRVRVGRVR